QQYLIVGPWTHSDAIYYPAHEYQGLDFGRHAAIELDQIKLDWFDRWLRGNEESWRDVPKVHLFETGTNVWLSGDNWPLPATDQALHLSAENGGTLASEVPGSSEPSSYRYDPMDPVMP